jgi:hypothetical protein
MVAKCLLAQVNTPVNENTFKTTRKVTFGEFKFKITVLNRVQAVRVRTGLKVPCEALLRYKV